MRFALFLVLSCASTLPAACGESTVPSDPPPPEPSEPQCEESADPSGAFEHPCTEQGIRCAIEAGGGPRTFRCDGPTVVVTLEELVIDRDVILDGEGNLTVDGDWDHRVFSVDRGVTAALQGMTITRGLSQGAPGGGVANSGSLTLRDVVVTDNVNQPTRSGAGAGEDVGGGGIHNRGVLEIFDTTVSDNTATEGQGGGIFNDLSATLRVLGSTISGNGASVDGTGLGGGVYNVGEATITNSTISNNGTGGLFGGSGGGIYTAGSLSLTSTTLSGNTASEGSEGVGGIEGADGTIEISHSIIDGDCKRNAVSTTWTSGGYNLESPGETCGLTGDGDQVGVAVDALRLGPLQNNGGATETHALGDPGSAAADAIPVDECQLTTDQRGVERPQGDACDIGAFELALQ